MNAMSDDEGFGENTLEFGEEHVGESDRETVPFSASNKRMKEMPTDRFIELPDDLLIHILSFLGVEQAGVTSVLSKRWKYLWAELPRLEFWRRRYKIKNPLEFVSWINRTIAIRKGNYLEKFQVTFNNCDESFVSDIDAWVEFSVKNQVKQLILSMGFGFGESYTLPQMIYSCSSLTFLNLSSCIMPSETRIEWQFLTRLFLDKVGLSQRLIDEILSSCPALTSLELEACMGFNRLEVNSRCVNYLRVREAEEAEDYVPYLEISAPYVSDLDIAVILKEGRWQLKNISYVLKASINFLYGDFSEEVIPNATEFLEKFKQVKKLDIGSLCFQVVSIMAKNGRQLPQFKQLQHLTISCWSESEHTISAIVCLLESSPNLETLFLEALEYSPDNRGEIADLAPNEKNDLDGDSLHLKEISINNFDDPNGEPLLILAQILLTRSPVLEDMTIEVRDASNFFKIRRTLLTYPKSSTNAKIHFLLSELVKLTMSHLPILHISS